MSFPFIRFPARFAEQPRAWIFAEMSVALVVIAALDFATSYHIRLLPFYVPPIFVVAWFCGKRAGLVAGLVSGLTWWLANWFNGDPYLHGLVQVWDIFRVVGFFLVVAVTGGALRSKSDAAAGRIALLEHSRRLEHEIVNISDDEQRRIGQDLHDGLCQYLAALSCSAASLREDLEKSQMAAEARTAGELATHLQDAVVQTRDLARGLVPAHVAQLGLSLALEALAQSVTRLHRVQCTFEVFGQVSAPNEEVALHLYRIAQEAIHNGIKHGKAKNIRVSLQSTGDLLTLCISDDGAGISEACRKGVGLAIMRYRARITGGEMRIEQPEGGGTIIVCTAKMNPESCEIAAA